MGHQFLSSVFTGRYHSLYCCTLYCTKTVPLDTRHVVCQTRVMGKPVLHNMKELHVQVHCMIQVKVTGLFVLHAWHMTLVMQRLFFVARRQEFWVAVRFRVWAALTVVSSQLSDRARERKVPATRISRLVNFGGTFLTSNYFYVCV